jgi:hypothetical protein
MNSLKKWLTCRIWPWIAARLFRLNEIEKFIELTDERYLDAATWAQIRGISIAEATRQLQEGLKRRYLDECLLYEWSDAPVRFVVPDTYVGRTVRLADVGYIGEDDEREVLVSPNRVRKVYIAADSGT